MSFDHEKLRVYNEGLKFVSWTEEIIRKIRQPTKDQLDRASTSIVLNIAEGNGNFSIKDRARFFEIAYGSATECAGCLDVIVARKLAKPEEIVEGKELLKGIVSMLVG